MCDVYQTQRIVCSTQAEYDLLLTRLSVYSNEPGSQPIASRTDNASTLTVTLEFEPIEQNLVA